MQTGAGESEDIGSFCRAFSSYAKDDVKCPLCLDLIEDAFITKCGHSFCFACITKHLAERSNCPSCGIAPLTKEDMFPNYNLNKLSRKLRLAKDPSHFVSSAIRSDDMHLSVAEIDNLLFALSSRKRAMQQESTALELDICAEFLTRGYKQREEMQTRLSREMAMLLTDLQQVKHQIAFKCADRARGLGGSEKRANIDGVPFTTRDETSGTLPRSRPAAAAPALAGPLEDGLSSMSEPAAGAGAGAGAGAAAAASPQRNLETFNMKKRRVQEHFNDLQAAYFDMHERLDGRGTALAAFQESLSKFTKHSTFQVFASLKYGSIHQSSTIVSSIEFDPDNEYFATAGVTKKIKIYQYSNIVGQPQLEVHHPVREMAGRSKISCLSWNPYMRDRIANSDYEGIVTLWDAYTGSRVITFEEHEKRAWSVDFSPAKPTCLASGSDDTKVKIWSLETDHSVATIDGKANVCCVRFNPENPFYLAFGSADHNIHYYDLRNLQKELFMFKGHSKAVSYVKFLSSTELVSASTDSTLKLWNTSTTECQRTFVGHINEKNFVGLSTCGDFIACGSENCGVYCYYKELTKPVAQYRFRSAEYDDVNNFVSSVCWKTDSEVLIAANSLGVISLMQFA